MNLPELRAFIRKNQPEPSKQTLNDSQLTESLKLMQKKPSYNIKEMFHYPAHADVHTHSHPHYPPVWWLLCAGLSWKPLNNHPMSSGYCTPKKDTIHIWTTHSACHLLSSSLDCMDRWRYICSVWTQLQYFMQKCRSIHFSLYSSVFGGPGNLWPLFQSRGSMWLWWRTINTSEQT